MGAVGGQGAGGSGDTPALLSGLECGGETKSQLNSRSKEAGAAWQKMQSSGMDFYAMGINKLISHWQNVLIIMASILINKDV